MATDSERLTAAGGDLPAASRLSGADPFQRTDPPAWSVTLWPHRSLPPKGFRQLMWFCAVMMALPILALSGTPAAALTLTPYVGAALLALWALIRLSYRNGRLTEELRLWPDVIAVERREPRGRIRRWAANPYWVDIRLVDTRNIEHYLTLRGAGRKIELGAFLTPDERVALAAELRARIAALHRPI